MDVRFILVASITGCSGPPRQDDPQLGFLIEVEQSDPGTVSGVCLEGPPEIDAVTGLARCAVTEVSGAGCGTGRVSAAGACVICQQGDGTLQTTDAGGNDVTGCAVSALAGDGWRYEEPEASAECPKGGALRFTGAGVPPPGARVRIECIRDRSTVPAPGPTPFEGDAGP